MGRKYCVLNLSHIESREYFLFTSLSSSFKGPFSGIAFLSEK